jgi:hypothetical protein
VTSTRRRAAVGAGAALLVLVPTSVVWACVGVVSLTSSSSSVQPGGTLQVTGREFAQMVPVVIHLDSPTGPVLATVPGPDDTMTSKFTTSVTVPANIPSGQHFLVATQDQHDMNSGAPARSVFYVGTSPPATSPLPARPAAMVASSGPRAASLIFIGLAVAVVALIVAALITLASCGRGRDRAAAATSS